MHALQRAGALLPLSKAKINNGQIERRAKVCQAEDFFLGILVQMLARGAWIEGSSPTFTSAEGFLCIRFVAGRDTPHSGCCRVPSLCRSLVNRQQACEQLSCHAIKEILGL